MSKLSIRDLDLNGKRVFIRVDFNVPLDKVDGAMKITSDKRITKRKLSKAGKAAIVDATARGLKRS